MISRYNSVWCWGQGGAENEKLKDIYGRQRA